MKKRWIVLIVIVLILALALGVWAAVYQKISGKVISEGVAGALEAGVIVTPHPEGGEGSEAMTVEEYLKEDANGERLAENFPEGTRIELPEAGVDSETGKTVSVPIEALDKNNQKKLEEMVSAADRAAAVGILARGLPPEQYSKIMGLAVPPVTSAKIGAASAIIRQYMTYADANELKAIAYKYMHLLDEIKE